MAQLISHLLPKTLFGRLALLLFVAVLASHVLANDTTHHKVCGNLLSMKPGRSRPQLRFYLQ